MASRKKVQKNQSTQTQNNRFYNNDEFSIALWAVAELLVNEFELEEGELQNLLQRFAQIYAGRAIIRRGYGFARWAEQNKDTFVREQS